MKIAKILLTLVIVATGLYLIINNLDLTNGPSTSLDQQPENMTESQKLAQLLLADLENLVQENLLPLELQNLSKVSITAHSERAKKWLEEERFNGIFNQSKEGKFSLEIDVLEWTEENKSGAIFQLNLFENSTKNKIWEISRSYTL